jgi:thioredoxin 1
MVDLIPEESVMELDDAHWETVVERCVKPIVVMFYDVMCPHCMAMMSHFVKYSREFKDKVLFARIDVAGNPFSVGRYGVIATPTFKFFCKGRPVREAVGEIYPTSLKSITEEALEYSKDCGSRSTPIDYDIGYA